MFQVVKNIFRGAIDGAMYSGVDRMGIDRMNTDRNSAEDNMYRERSMNLDMDNSILDNSISNGANAKVSGIQSNGIQSNRMQSNANYVSNIQANSFGGKNLETKSRYRTGEINLSEELGLLAFNGSSFGSGFSGYNYSDFSAQAEHLFSTNVVVYRCISLISKSLASVPWFFTDKEGPVADHELNYLLQAPNPLQGKETFLENLISNLLMFGNAYIYKTGKDGLYSMHVLKSNKVNVVGSKPNMPDYYSYNNGVKAVKIPVNQRTGESDVLHLKLFDPDSEYHGMSPCKVIENAVMLYNKVTEHNLSLLKRGGRPSGMLVLNPETLTDQKLQQTKEDVSKWVSGASNAGEVLVVGGDCEWKELGLKPLETDFLNGKHMASREIAQVFGVPPMLIGITGDATFANYKEARVHFWEDTIIPLMKKICSEMSVWFFQQFGVELKYDIEGIEALSPRREAVWSKISQASFLTINEKRAELGYPPLEYGDRLDMNMSASCNGLKADCKTDDIVNSENATDSDDIVDCKSLENDSGANNNSANNNLNSESIDVTETASESIAAARSVTGCATGCDIAKTGGGQEINSSANQSKSDVYL